MVFLKSFDNYFYANLLLSRLKNDGVRCTLFDENTVTTDPLLSNAIGGIKLMVHQADEDMARNFIDLYEREYLETSICEKCGASDFEKMIRPATPDLEARIIRFFQKDHQLPAEIIFRCNNCLYETKALPQ